MLAGLVGWVVAMSALGPLLLDGPISPLVGPFVAVLPGIIVAGLVVRARTARRWITIAILTIGLNVAVGAAIFYAFLQSGFMDG
jgi:hypothetical protein